MCRMYLFDPDTLEIGERNGVFVTGLEHKMGLKASPTCELTFGAHGRPAVGYLVGDVHNGIAQMFTVIENARMTIGVKSAGTLSTGYLNALAYAKERVQGADLTQMSDKTAPRVTILHHPDVRRSLMTQKAYAEGLRALYMYAAAHQNNDVAERISGADPSMAHRVDDLLLPLVKGVGLRTGVRGADRVAADARRIGLPAGLSDRAVHPRRQDRLALRGHHGDPVAGLLLPQGGPRPRRGAGACRGPDHANHRVERWSTQAAGARCWPRPSRMSRRCWPPPPGT